MINTFITEFYLDYNVISNIQSDKFDISNNEWIVYNPKVYEIQKKIGGHRPSSPTCAEGRFWKKIKRGAKSIFSKKK